MPFSSMMQPELFIRTAQSKFSKLDPAELNDLYNLEEPYFWLKYKLQTQGLSALTDSEQMDVLSKKSETRLNNALTLLGNKLYDLCRCINICHELDYSGYGVCPNCMEGTEGSYAEDEDSDLGQPASMKFDFDEDSEGECEFCGHRMTYDEWESHFPTGGSDYGMGNISAFMSQWGRLAGTNDIPNKIVVIHTLLNAIHGSGAMAPMFFSGKTGDIRTKLDQLSGNFEDSASNRMASLSKHLDEKGFHIIADSIDEILYKI